MADLEITAEEIKGIDVNTIASMQLKDGTTIVINQEEVAQAEGEFVEEQAQEGEQELVQEEQAEAAEIVEGQENQLRARPIPGRMVPPVVPRPLIAPVPVRPAVVPVPVPARPAVVPVKPLIRPPVVPMRPAVVPPRVFRARPGMPIARPPVMPKVVPVPVHKPAVMPKVVPVPVPVKPAVVPMKPAVVPKVVPVPVPVKPAVVPMHKPVVPVVARPMPVPVRPVFRARPNVEQEEEAEEYDYQQEEVAGEEQYCECDAEECQEGQEEQLRARPMMMVPPRHPPMVAPRPRVVPVPVPVMPPRRGPMVGYNTFQPRVFRARPRPYMAAPMFTPMTTYTPMAYGRPRMHHYGMRGPMVRPVPMMRPRIFRGKERSNSFDAKDEQYDEYCENQCTKSVCTKCGKEF